MKTPEGYEKDDIKKFLESIGAWLFLPHMAGYGKSGVPDIVFCYRGRFCSVEVKREGKQPTTRQWQRINEIQAVGGKAFWGTAEKVIAEIKSGLGSYNEMRNEYDEYDVYIMQRARNGADAPYDQDTCRCYPWAAAARISYLEGVLAVIKPK